MCTLSRRGPPSRCPRAAHVRRARRGAFLRPAAAATSPRTPAARHLCNAKIRVRIDGIDAYQATRNGRREPAIRVYGPADVDGGAQCVVHVHGAYPYLYVPLPPREDAHAVAAALHSGLEAKLGELFHRKPGGPRAAYVHRVRACRAFAFYGYAPGFECFLKIELLNPTYVYKCSELLVQGALFNTPMQPHEAHIPYILAFLADYNLYGCQWMDFGSDYTERLPASSARTAYEGREVDIDAAAILNRQGARQNTHHAALFEPADSSIAISSLAELRSTDAKRRARLGVDAWPGMQLLPREDSVARAMRWQWERSAEHAVKLSELVGAPRAGPPAPPPAPAPELPELPEWPQLPTAAELVSSKYALPAAQPEETTGSQPPTQSQTRTQTRSEPQSQPRSEPQSEPQSQPTQLQATQGAAGAAAASASVLDEVRVASQDSQSVFAAAHDASFVLGAQFAPQARAVADKISGAFGLASAALLGAAAPSTADVARTTGITTNMQPHYSNPADASALPFSFAGEDHRLKTMLPRDLPPFDIAATDAFTRLAAYVADEAAGPRVAPRGREPRGREPRRLKRFELAAAAPTYAQVEAWQREVEAGRLSGSASTGSAFQFASLEEPDAAAEEMLLLAIEVCAQVRPGKAPNAACDAVCAVFWQLSGQPRGVPWDARCGSDSSSASASPAAAAPPPLAGVISTSAALGSTHVSTPSLHIECVADERALLEALVQMTRRFNPDILTGYEVAHSSWGYVRARYKELQADGSDAFFEQLSRVRLPHLPGWKLMTSGTGAPAPEAETVRGRHLLSLWNILRREVTLSKYTLEHVVYHTLHERTPHYEFDDLWRWWTSGDAAAVGAVVRYWTRRVAYVLRLFAHFEIVSRTCEKSRIIGLDFMSSLTRGSQFQVEAVMCRLARRDNFLLLSPTKRQVGQQNALEYIPLVMEPMSAFYTDPVCVLDFRSLYPSIVIAFNLCYSTCIGRLDAWRGRNKLGVKQDHAVPRGALRAIGAENVYVAPNGIAYVAPAVRRSLLARMLGEILESRFMLNDSKRSNMANRRYQRNLNSQQLALKFIANVTYGYTSASFSGRMPCAELADSIVLTGRELLQWCIQQIEGCGKWGVQAQVVYGDTDSLFVRLPNVTREQAFRIGGEIADMVTRETPDPILLKLEKVYSPCVLLTKKRYVGNAYEDAHAAAQPRFDAKGTETVRRDGTPIVQKLERRALQILFASADLSRVKAYLQNEWRRILSGRVLVQDFCFAQEVKLGHYKTPAGGGTSNLPGGAVVSLRRLAKDEGADVLYRERVPFVITAGAPGSRINDRAVSPEEVVRTPGLQIDAEYYIQKTIIPPLERLLNMIGANVREWYTAMPRSVRAAAAEPVAATTAAAAGAAPARGASTLLGFFANDTCACCLVQRRTPPDVLCAACRAREPRSRYVLVSRAANQQRTLAAAAAACRLCSELPPSTIVHGAPPPGAAGAAQAHPCTSLDCPVFYEREQARGEAAVLAELANSI